MKNLTLNPLIPLPYVKEQPTLTGSLRQTPEHFFVEEILGFEPSGEGEHVFIQLEKRELNTQQLADRIAKIAGVTAKHISYSGMKDRNAVTKQWFSVHLPGKRNIDFSSLESSSVKLLAQERHSKKLRRGVHRGNRFEIVLTGIEGGVDAIQKAVSRISRQGVPNYFGEQRFGRDGANVTKGVAWFSGVIKPSRHQRSLYLSAVRSFLFNELLAERVRRGSWNTLTQGELLMLQGSHSVFLQNEDANLGERLNSGDIHLTGPLYGEAVDVMPQEETGLLEQSLLDLYPELLAGLHKHSLKAQRRALRVIPEQLSYQRDGNSLQLSFYLPSGCFATSVVRELVNYQYVNH